MSTDDKGTEPTTEENPEDALGDAGKKALAAERDARKKAESEVAELRKWKESRELDDLRSQVASDKGLTSEQLDALVGDSKEELEAHADKLKALVPKAGKFSPNREALRPGASNEDDADAYDYEKIAEKLS